MKERLVELLRDPLSGDPLELTEFERQTDNIGEGTILEGILFNRTAGTAYPIVNGVPVMIPSAFPEAFIRKHSTTIGTLNGVSPLQVSSGAADDYSFSEQWDEYFEQRVARTWGWTISERIEQLFMEMQVPRDWFQGKTILDAGCGPGDLAQGIAELGADVVGFDYSSSVYWAERHRKHSNLQFIRGDLSRAGLKSEGFDAAICMGVLMFTPNAQSCLAELCRVVKPGGRVYVGIDRHADTFFGRYIRYSLLDLCRAIISRLPPGPRASAVKAWATLVYSLHRVAHGKAKVPFNQYLVSAYNDMTPRWRRYYSPYELAGWFYRNGFGPPVLSHWDNPYSFGLLSIKQKQDATPGIHFGSSPKLWDHEQTIVG